MAMLVGELDYDGTFINNDNFSEKFQEKKGLITLIQIMSILFLCFGSIVIMNLLVGLTVSEIDKLKSEAWQVSLKEKFSELLSDRPLFFKGGKAAEKEGKEDPPILKELLSKRRKKFNLAEQEPLKICVKPNAKETEDENSVNDEMEDGKYAEEIRKTCHTWMQNLLWVKRRFIPKKYKVYFYGDSYGRGHNQKEDTGFRFENGLIENTLKYLKEKEILRNDLEAQLIDTEGMEDVVSKHAEEILDFLRKRLGTGLET